MRSTIVFSCDQNYVPLAKGLVLSLADFGFPNKSIDLALIDIGCTPESLGWMEAHNVRVVPFDQHRLELPKTVRSVLQPYQYAQILRPWIPSLLPDYDDFIWFDSDIWLQNGDVVTILQNVLANSSSHILLAPGFSHNNRSFHLALSKILVMQNQWFRASYDDAALVENLSVHVHFSSGVFGMSRACKIWDLWGQEVIGVYSRLASAGPSEYLHLAEQIALNAVVRRTNLFRSFDPIYNFHCNSGGLARPDPNGKVRCIMMLPCRDAEVIHLANWPTMKKNYVELGMLYKKGGYLSDSELAAMLA